MAQQERWQLSGSGPENYERYQVPSIFAPLARIFLDHVPVRNGQRLLDVACGTGIVARTAAPALGGGGSVVGVDLNPGMLAVAAEKAPEGGASFDWREGDVADLPCPDDAFDIVLCQQGLQFFPDKPAALREMHRVLAPGGQVALCVWRTIEHSPCNQATAAGLARHVNAEEAVRIQAPFALGEADVLRNLLDDAGFSDIEIKEAVLTRRMLPPEESIPGHIASTPVGPSVAALDPETRAALVADIAEALAPYRDADGLAIPQGTHIALARK